MAAAAPPSAFGSLAERFAPRLGRSDVVLADLPVAADAYLAAVDRRFAGAPCYGMLLWDDLRSRVAFELSAQLLAQAKGFDERRATLEQFAAGTLVVNGVPSARFFEVDPAVKHVACEFVRLCSGLVVFSNNQAERFAATFGMRSPLVAQISIPHTLPAFEPKPGKGLSVVVWAPQLVAAETALLAFALEKIHGDVYVICTGGDRPDVRATYLARDDPRIDEVLSAASCVVDGSLSDPGAALAFAQHGVPLATPVTNGAHERIGAVALFDPWSPGSIYQAVLRAAGTPSILLGPARIEPPPLRISSRAWLSHVGEPPKVSIVIPTYNRLEILRESLAMLSRQTYPVVEIVVVNDGGESPASVTNDFPNVVLLDRSENVGAERAVNAGLGAATGTYLGVIPDDDHFYPDHVERLVDVLERTGAMVAHANCLARYQRLGADGRYHDIGYNASAFIGEVDPSLVYAFTSLINHAWLVRREALELAGAYEHANPYAEYLMQLELLSRFDFVHVDHVTCDWVMREGDWGAWRTRSKSGPEALRAIFARFPVEGNPIVQQIRERVLKATESPTFLTDFLFPPSIVLREPRP